MTFTQFLDIAVIVGASGVLGCMVGVSLKTLRGERQADREAVCRRLEQLTRPAIPEESTESYEAAAAVFEMRAADDKEGL